MSCSRSSVMSNSDRSRWKLTEQTMIRVRINLLQHTKYSNMTLMTHRPEILIRAPSARVPEDDIQQQTPTPDNNTQGLREQMHSSNEATQRCLQRHASPSSKFQFFERHERQHTAYMIFEGEPAVKLHAKISRLGLAQI